MISPGISRGANQAAGCIRFCWGGWGGNLSHAPDRSHAALSAGWCSGGD